MLPQVALLLASTLAPKVLAQSDALTSKHFTWPNVPEQVDTDPTGRGPQFGFNICNSTTENQQSDCQTAFVNSASDFCLWSSPDPNETIGDTEAREVAWCSKPGHGTRLIPAGAITAVQFMRTPDYVQVVGRINQAMINLQSSDPGGELDPHGADERGNPLGGLVFTNAFPASNGDNNTFIQAIEWHNYMGGDMFCFKACDPAGANAANFCQHIFDRIGTLYNCPAAYTDGVFESCLGDDQDFPGVFTSNGVVMTFSQPPESLGPISSIPYTPRIPASSSCTTFASTDLFVGLPGSTSSASATGSRASTSSGARATSTSGSTGAAVSINGLGAVPLIGVIATLLGVAAGFMIVF